MKTKFIIIMLVLISMFKYNSYGQFFPDPGDPGTMTEKKRHIEQGSHSTVVKPKKIRTTHTNRRYKFHLIFHNECWYNPELGCGWNKVGRISYGNGGVQVIK